MVGFYHFLRKTDKIVFKSYYERIELLFNFEEIMTNKHGGKKVLGIFNLRRYFKEILYDLLHFLF